MQVVALVPVGVKKCDRKLAKRTRGACKVFSERRTQRSSQSGGGGAQESETSASSPLGKGLVNPVQRNRALTRLYKVIMTKVVMRTKIQSLPIREAAIVLKETHFVTTCS